MKLKPGDLIVYAIVIIAIVWSYRLSGKFPLNYVEVTTPYKKLIFPLKQDKVITVKGAIGKLTFIIKNGRVKVLHSSCSNKICIKTGWISSSGEYIACVPNRILIKLINRKKSVNKFDFITE